MRCVGFELPKQCRLVIVFLHDGNGGNFVKIGAPISQHHHARRTNLFAARLREANINMIAALFKGQDRGTPLHANFLLLKLRVQRRL